MGGDEGAAEEPVSLDLGGEELSDDEVLLDLDLGADEAAAPLDLGGGEVVAEEPPAPLDLGVADEAGADQAFELDIPDDGGLDLGVEETPLEEAPVALDLGDLGEVGAEDTVSLGAGTLSEEVTPLDLGDLDGGGADDAVVLDLDLGGPAAVEPATNEAPDADVGMELDLDLGGEEISLDLGAVEEGGIALDLGVEEELAGDQTIILDAPAAESAPAPVAPADTSDEALDLGEGGLPSDVDEVANKLDLARAFIGMGDEEGAKALLEEVMAEGNEAQKQQAKEML